MMARTRARRAGTVIADVAEFLARNGTSGIAAIHDEVNARRRRRELPEVARASIRGTLNSNTGDKGQRLFRREGRGLYSLSRGRRSSS